MSEVDKNIIKGYCKQEGNPTPDNPVEIETLELPFKNKIPSYKSADKMFEELGYKKKEVTNEFIVYSKKELRFKREWEVCIDFNCYDKYLVTKNKQYFCKEELQAINLKVKELGWYE